MLNIRPYTSDEAGNGVGHGHKGLGSITTGPDIATTLPPLTSQVDLLNEISPNFFSTFNVPAPAVATPSGGADYGFTDGLGLWFSDPSTALTMLPSAFQNFNLSAALGVWTPPIIIGLVALGALKKK